MIRRLSIANFRCIVQAEIELDPRCTVFVGANGSGKTSILEAAHVLSCGRSFRSHRLAQLIRSSADEFVVVGEVAAGDGHVVAGIRGRAEEVEAHLRGERVKGMADLAAQLPLYVIDPNIHRVLEDGPENRRRLLDRGLFHVEQTFVYVWRRYQRALKQRNAALKSGGSAADVRIWEPELVDAGTAISSARAEYIAQLRPRFLSLAQRLLGRASEIEFRPGWVGDLFAEDLERNRDRDRRQGTTTVGPHRADLVIRYAGHSAKQYVSRGQQKLLATTLVLSQVAEFSERIGRPACLLLDDPAAELDVDNFARLMLEIEHTDAQLLVTGLDAELLSRRFSSAMFHVEQGRVRSLL